MNAGRLPCDVSHPGEGTGGSLYSWSLHAKETGICSGWMGQLARVQKVAF